MRKLIAALAVVALFSVRASAQSLDNAQSVKSVVPYATDCSTMSLGTSAVDVSGNTTSASTSYGAYAVVVFNAHATQTVTCSNTSSVASGVGPVIAGSANPPYNWLAWGINRSQKWYCIASGASTPITICRYK